MASFSTLEHLTMGSIPKLRGEQLPIPVIFREVLFEDDFIEKGMRGLLTGAEHEDGGVMLHFFLGVHRDWNRRFLRRTYFTEHPGKLINAEEKGVFDDYYSVWVPADGKCTDFFAPTHETI
jgi:hypothetical protein